MSVVASSRSLLRQLWSDLRFKAGCFIVAMVLATVAYAAIGTSQQTTDNAQVQCDMVPVPAQVRGVIAELSFQDDQYVTAGHLLARIEAENYKSRLAQAEADLVAAKLTAQAAEAQSRLSAVSARGESALSPVALQSSEAALQAADRDMDAAQAVADAAAVTFAESRRTHQRQVELHQQGFISNATLENAENKFKSDEANLAAAQARLAALIKSRDVARARLDETRKRGKMTLDSEQLLIERARAEAVLAAARADAAQAVRDVAAVDFAHTQIYAKQAGVVSSRRVSVGQIVEAGQPIATIVTCPSSAWVVANFKETQVGNMHVGQPAQVRIDTYPGVAFTGRVAGLSGATGARFSLLPPENATGNFTRVVQRIPVRIALISPPRDKPLMAGISAVVTVSED